MDARLPCAANLHHRKSGPRKAFSRGRTIACSPRSISLAPRAGPLRPISALPLFSADSADDA
jgi:hypothetical protein